MRTSSLVVHGDISHLIYQLRGSRVILDFDLARLYDLPTKALNQAVKRNQDRFPEAFMFQVTARELANLRSQIVTSSFHGGRRYLPYAFTEHGALMAANVLNSRRAVAVSVKIVMAFVRMRRVALSVEGLARKIDVLERKYDNRFRVVFSAIRQLMPPL